MMASDLDILLVNIGGTKKKVYQELSQDFSAIDPPFWAALTAGFIRKQGFSVDILDAGVLNLDIEETVKEVVRRSPKQVAILVYSQQANVCTPIMVAVGQLCRALKDQAPHTRLILTGWHPSSLPLRTLQEEACDMIAQGEGFKTLLGLLENRELKDIPGLWWKSEGRILHNPSPPNIEDLSGVLGDVAWDLLPLASGHYRAFNWMCLQSLETRNHFASMMTSLGCPFHCTFCAIHSTFGERRIRYWSPEWVLRQVDVLVNQYGIKHINLNDELFVFNPRHYLPIANGLVERSYGVNLCAFARVDRLDKMKAGELELLKKAGFNWFKLGIETGSQPLLHLAHKGNYNKDIVRRVVKKVHDAGIDLCGNFMFGLPGETMETMQDTLNLALELQCAFPSFFCTMAIPGSDLYEEALQKGLPLPDTWLGYASQGYEFQPLPSETLSAAEILRFRDHAFHTYFTNPAYLQMIERKFGRAAREHVESMTKIKLKRKILGD